MSEENKTLLPQEELPAVDAAAPAEDSAAEKPDLLDYLESLPDVEDPFEPSEPEPEPEEKSDLELLAEYIRARSAAGVLTPKGEMLKENPELEEVFAQFAENEAYADIRTEQGKKDLYYYSTPTMAVNYAHMAMLAEEKDHCRTIADIVRWNCKIGPACTDAYFFTNHPYNMTKTQINVTLDLMKRREEYADIQETKSFNGKRYLYTTNRLSAKYAKALADFAEEGEHNM